MTRPTTPPEPYRYARPPEHYLDMVLVDGAVALWTFEAVRGGAIVDLVGEARHPLIPYGDVVLDADAPVGVPGQAVIPGDGGLLGVDQHEAFNIASTEPFTIEAWGRLDAADAAGSMIFERVDTAGPNVPGFEAYIRADGQPELLVRGEGAADEGVVTWGAAVVDDAYHHLVFIRDPAAGQLRVVVDNGPAVVADDESVDDLAQAGDLFLGSHYDGTQPFPGRLAAVAFYDRALTTTEIAQHWEAGNGRTVWVSPTALEWWTSWGPIAEDDSDENNWLGLRLADAIAGLLEPVEVLARDEGARPGWANILDLDRVPDIYLEYLGRFVGVRVNRGAVPALERQRIVDRLGFARGRPSAIIAAAQAHLTGDRTVALTERDGGAYRMTIRTYVNETPDPNVLEEAVRAVTPAGIVIRFITVEGTTIDELVGTIDEQSSTVDGYIVG